MIGDYDKIWENLEKQQPGPHFFCDAISIDFEEFRAKVYSGKANAIIESMYQGNIYILKNTLTQENLKIVKSKIQYLNETEPTAPEFLKSDHNCLNFHFVSVDNHKDPSKYYAIDHSYFFFRWNKGSRDMFEEIDKYWKTCKYLGGYSEEVYQDNLPSDGVIDRLQIAQYPLGGGQISSHFDSAKNQRAQGVIIMSKKSVDYRTGGFNLFEKTGIKKNVELFLEPGDMIVFYPTL